MGQQEDAIQVLDDRITRCLELVHELEYDLKREIRWQTEDLERQLRNLEDDLRRLDRK